MTRVFCDRCGNPVAATGSTLTVSGLKTQDLCEDCRQSFDAWFAEGAVGEVVKEAIATKAAADVVAAPLIAESGPV